jgi:hypothetical protein
MPGGCCRDLAAQNTWVYTSNTTKSTYFWSTIKKGFTDAEQYCRDRGGHLAAWCVAGCSTTDIPPLSVHAGAVIAVRHSLIALAATFMQAVGGGAERDRGMVYRQVQHAAAVPQPLLAGWQRVHG